MDNVKNNFEELGKLLSGALAILEETNTMLANRVLELEKRVEVLEAAAKGMQVATDVEETEPSSEEMLAEETLAEETIADGAIEEDSVEEIEEVMIAEGSIEERMVPGGTIGEDKTIEEDMFEEDTHEKDTFEEDTFAEDTFAEDTFEEDTFEKDTFKENTFKENTFKENTFEENTFEENTFKKEVMAIEDGIDGDGVGAGYEDSTIAAEMEPEAVCIDLNSVFEESKGVQIVNEAAKPDWYDWEVDYPASYVDDVYKGISFNDRYEFIKELFNVSGSLDEAELLFKETLDMINEMDNFKKVVAYIRERFPQWDEQSDEVYRFYMAVRRKFNR